MGGVGAALPAPMIRDWREGGRQEEEDGTGRWRRRGRGRREERGEVERSQKLEWASC